MKREKNATLLSVLSWVFLIISLLTTAFLVVGIFWVCGQSVLTTETIAEYQSLSLSARYFHILSAGFFNLTWGLAFIGVCFVWFMMKGKGPSEKRIAWAVTLVFVQRFLQLTLVFLLMFSKLKS